MGSKEAIRKLRQAGFELVRRGKGDHVIMERDGCRVIVPDGKSEMSYGVVQVIRHALKHMRVAHSKQSRQPRKETV